MGNTPEKESVKECPACRRIQYKKDNPDALIPCNALAHTCYNTHLTVMDADHLTTQEMQESLKSPEERIMRQ